MICTISLYKRFSAQSNVQFLMRFFPQILLNAISYPTHHQMINRITIKGFRMGNILAVVNYSIFILK